MDEWEIESKQQLAKVKIHLVGCRTKTVSLSPFKYQNVAVYCMLHEVMSPLSPKREEERERETERENPIIFFFSIRTMNTKFSHLKF